MSTAAATKGVTEDLGVLVVEDEPEVRRLMISHLSEAGYCVYSAASGAESLQICEADVANRIRLLILDLHLPDNASKSLDRICAIRPTLPILICTGGGDDNIRSALGRRDLPLLRKPFDRKALLGAVAELVEAGC